MIEDVLRHISRQRDRIIEWQRALTALPALGPENGGQGEQAKAECIKRIVRGMGLSVETVNAPDPRVESGHRPNLVSLLPGATPRTLWILGHMDVVPPGDRTLWRTDPWALTVDGDALYGRGVEDNQQGIVGALLIAQALKELDVTPGLTLGLMFVSDEETGNAYGIRYLLENRPELIGKDDMLVAPDFGMNTGEQICVSEKSMLWLKVTVNGLQSHAARPAMARNALVAASHMIVRMQDSLERMFPEQDILFEAAPGSTFTPTRHDANVPNINTVPGKDVFYIDCRVLPCHDVQDVRDRVRMVLEEIALENGVDVLVDVVHARQAPPSAPLNSALVRSLERGIRRIYQVEPRPVGSGGGTVAGEARCLGISAVAWSKAVPAYHEPNERSSIANTIGDAQVMAAMLFDAEGE